MTRIRTLNFLPEIFKTSTNSQFLAATLDQIVQQPNTKKIEGYIGSKFGYGINAKDYYVTEPSKIRTDYQLDPGVVFKKTNENTAKDFISYPGILDALALESGIVSNNNRLFNSEIYAWDSFTDLDKNINFNQYYWLPDGPPSVVVSNQTVFSTNDYDVIDLPNGYNIVPTISSENAGATNPTLTLLRGGTYTFAINQDTGFWIQGEPGVTGYSSTQPNMQTRDILGVDNNGASQGIVVFTVPSKDAQSDYDFPGNNTVDVVSNIPFANVNGARVADFVGIDGVTSLDGLRVMFYNTGIPNEVGYISNFFDYSPYDQNTNITELKTVTITNTNAATNAITCNSTANLIVGNAIVFDGTPFGGIASYSTTLPNTIYFVHSILNSTQFIIATSINGPAYSVTTASGSMTGIVNQGMFEQGYYSNVNDYFYTINYIGDLSDPVIRLTQSTPIPTNQKITSTYGTQWIYRSFYKNTSGSIILIPYLSAQLDTLYYQDGTYSNKVGVIRLIESNSTNSIDIETDILGKKQYTATNGVVFTNGLKVTFQGDIFPNSYLTGEYYVEGVGTAIELLPVENFVSPEAFTSSIYVPWDTAGWDVTAWEGNSYIPVTPDYITIARNSLDRNAWSRSNRWFHIDVITATATYNNNPDLITEYTISANKAKRPIIEFYPNLKLFNSGSEGKDPVDFIDTRTTDAFTYVAGNKNYYPDVEVYTGYTGNITATDYSPLRYISGASNVTGIFTMKSGYDTTGFRINDSIVFSDITPGSGITAGGTYFVSEIISSSQFKISSTKDGISIIPTVTIASDYLFTWDPQTTIVTINANDIVGNFTVGQYITDSTNRLPKNSQILSISGTTTVSMTVGWDESSSGYIPSTSGASFVATDTTNDNYSLFDGASIVFCADTTAGVRNKIFTVRLSTITGSTTPVITLSESKTGDILYNHQTVAKRGYFNRGKEFWFGGSNWINGQQKTQVNQAPLFDVFDANGISFSDSDIYIGTSFVGSKLFSYGLGSGTDDNVLGFPIKYSSVDNIGDINFDVAINSDTFNYVNNTTPITQKINTGYVYQYTSRTTFDREIGWQTAVSPSVQYQMFSFEYDILKPTNSFICDISKLSSSTTNWPTIEVSINNRLLSSLDYTLTVAPESTTIVLNEFPIENTVVQISLLSNQVSKTAFYSIPTNLNNNPLNGDLTTVNIGDIRRQYQSAYYNNPNSYGVVFGANNYRDLGNMVIWSSKIIQNSASLVLPGVFLRKQEHNLFNSLLFNQREYVKFKNLLVYTIQNSDYLDKLTPAQMLDQALDEITASKDESLPFFWSDMLPNKSVYTSNTYSFANSLDVSVYPLTRVYDFNKANYNGVLVYLTRTVSNTTITSQLIKDQDYLVSDTAPSLTVTKDLAPGDIITINEYTQTYGSYVPNTPTKLGLYPAYVPEVILDINYNEPTYFIKGHDGSYNKLYGSYDIVNSTLTDLRDQVLLEFELRIYNNLKIQSDVSIKEYDIIPGFFRNTDYSYTEWLQLYTPNFLNWVGQNRLNYKTQYFNNNNSFTFNYSKSGNSIDAQPVSQGYWRGLYEYFYDTSTPNTTPWEMLGFTEMPSWWTKRYGPAPYTSDNLVLWGDLAQGINWNDGNPKVIPQMVRTGLLDIIPVNSEGILLPPIDTMIGSYNENLFQREWKVGDVSPVELSYRRSSSYPFDFIKMVALMKPAQFFNLGVDLDNYKYNEEFNQYLVNNRHHLNISDIEIYGNGVAKTSYINWIVDYEKQVGIDATNNLKEMLSNLDVRLVYRVAGFSDKSLLKFYVEKGTPNTTNSSLLIPDESYSVLLYDNQPYSRIIYSGVIVQLNESGTYSIFGNSQTYAFFNTLKPKLGGKSETITVNDVSIKITPEHFDQIQVVPYNTVFYSVQEVSQFLIDYGAYLISLGMKFQDLDYDLEINWKQMVSEFLYWSQIGWSSGSIITLNPSAKSIVIDKESSIVQPLTLQQSNFLLNQNLYPIQVNDLSIVRQETEFRATSLNQGDSIAYGQFNLSNFEHGIVFDNITLFGDIIYNLPTGLRQNRINLRGVKSADWNGLVNASGFIYNQDNIKEWNNKTKYTKGEIVTYKNKYWISTKIIQASETFTESDWKRTDYDEIQKGLLPNASTRSYESSLYYDVNQANLENDADLLSFSLIGYRPRDYLALADLTDITQVNVYKNLIKEKGTLNAASAFKGARLPQGGIQYDLYENWAIKSGQFGGVLNKNFIEFKVNERYATGNPSTVGLTEGIHIEGVQQQIPLYSLFNYGRPVNSVDVLPTISNAPNVEYPDAGYVNFNDVKMSAFYFSQMETALDKNGSLVPIQDFYVRDYVWLANYLEKWQVFTPSSMGQLLNVKNNLNDTITLTFKDEHNLKQYQPFAIVNFDYAVDGYYLATVIIDQYKVLVNKTLDPSIKNITGQGIGLLLNSHRVSTASSILDLNLLNTEFVKNTIWVDTIDNGSWGVYRKTINYQLENQLTKSLSDSFGSAVAVNNDIGYLISDSDLGQVYRYTYNELSKSYELTQTIAGGVGFGSAINYAGNLYAISETVGATRKVNLYQLQMSLLSDDLVLYQSIPYPAGVTTWGTSVAISGNLNWIYISDIDNNTVYVYERLNINTSSGNFNVGQTYTIENVGTTDFTLVGATNNEVGISFVATGVGSGNGTARKTTYVNVAVIDGDLLGLTTAGDNFGYSLSTNYQGDKIIVGCPNKNSGSLDNSGITYVFQRTSQNLEVQFNSDTAQTFVLAWTPSTISKTVTSTNSTGNRINLNSVTSLAVNDPIIFTGSGFSGTNIITNQIYYIQTINVPSSYITVKTTRDSISAVSVTTNPTVNSTATVQSSPLIVSKNGYVVDDNNYAIVNDTLVYTNSLNAGDILNVSGHNIVLLETLSTGLSPQTGTQFGISVDTNMLGSEIIVGAPFYLNSQLHEGAVFRFTDVGAKFGYYIGTGICNITTTRKILINGYLIYLQPGNAESVANNIKSANVTNVTASAIDGKLVISLLNNDISLSNQRLTLGIMDNSSLNELGITTIVKTQEISCPHPDGTTQFGSVVKFNQYNSFVASAPVGTRFSNTTFDFTEDANQDDDTVFDNNATQFQDQSPNFGAVYMFDYISEYNPSQSSPGVYVYAQSINSPNIVGSSSEVYDQPTDITYSNQPKYGTALDFNDNSVIIGTPNDTGSTTGNIYAGSVTVYNNLLNIQDWSLYRYAAKTVDIQKIANIQLFSAETNNTLINLDYIDPLQGKILGAARENIDIVSAIDPASYNNQTTNNGNLVWGATHVGKIWLNTKNMRYVNYHQNDDVAYNSQYWATLFPGSDVAVYSWISSNVTPSEYTGPGVPYNVDSYSVQYATSPSGSLVPVYYFWARNTNIIFSNIGKTLADSIISSYVENPKNSGISYFAPLLPSVYSLYNASDYINANDSVLHIGFSTGSNDNVSHEQYNLIRDGYASDFLPGLPFNSNLSPDSLYDRLLDSLCGVDESGGVVPNPYLPKAVQFGVLARPRQSFFVDRFNALKNYLQYANTVLAQYPITEIRQSSFLTSSGEFYDTQSYWEYSNWWAAGYNNQTKSSLQVPVYATLSTLNVPVGTIVTVNTNIEGKAETYILETTGSWKRIGLENGTIQFKSSLWDYSTFRLGFGDNFFDTDIYDVYPSEETRKIVRALNEQIYIEDLLVYRNKGLILLFEYIQSESIQNQNYLPWLNKTSFVDVSHTIRELKPIEVFQSDNQDFLSGYLTEIKPYHVVIKEFLFKYTGNELYNGNISDFDLPAIYNSSVKQFVSPQLVYDNADGIEQYTPSDLIWQQPEYSQWFNNHGVALTGQDNVQITVVSSYISLNSEYFTVDNSYGFPINGVITIGDEQIGYSFVDTSLNIISGLTRGVNGTPVSTHIPGDLIYIDLPAVLVLDGGRGYSEPPKVTAYIDTTIYPEPTTPAILSAVMSLDSVLRIDVIDPGQGYAVLPKIIIDSAFSVNFSSDGVNLISSTLRLFAPLLSTGDLIQYKIGENTTEIGGLVNNQWYYINVLETLPSVVIALYDNYADAINNKNRVTFYTIGTGDNHFLALGARASAISSASPVRENNITLRFDRTSYNSELIDWVAGRYYGAYYAGSYSNSDSVASSSITLESSQPPIASILASAQGIAFEITDVRNDRVVNYSSFTRYVGQTFASTDSIRLILQDDGSGNPNASGGTLGFYVGMPIKFVGFVGSSGITDETVYYVNSIISLTDFTISSNSTGSPLLPVNDFTIGPAGLSCFVGEVTDTAIIGVNYPGILNITETEAVTNKITVPLYPTGSGGTRGFYVNIPIFFTGTDPDATNNGMFGGIIENETYYVTTIVDNETFTMSKTKNPVNFTVLSTIAATNVINITGDTQKIAVNEPVIFNNMIVSGNEVTTFGNIVSGKTYYISSIISTTSFKISESINGAAFSLTNVSASSTTSALVTSQKNTVSLVSATGNNMVVNVSLPVSPGQVNGQKFSFYPTSGQYPGLTGTNGSLINRGIDALISSVIVSAGNFVIGETYTISVVGTTNFVAIGASANTVGVTFTATGGGTGTGKATVNVYKVALTNYNEGDTVARWLTGIYTNMPVRVLTSYGSGFLNTGTTYYVADFGIIEVDVTYTSATGNLLTCESTASLYVNMPITFSGSGVGGVQIGVLYWVQRIADDQHFTISDSLGGVATVVTNSSGFMTGTGAPYIKLSSTLGGVSINPGSTQQSASITIASPAVITVGSAPSTGTKIIFKTTGSLPTGIIADTTYYVTNLSPTTFKISLTPSGSDINTSGTQSGVHTMIITTESRTEQYPTAVPTFDVSYILGGYRVVINNSASGFAINNTITIAGTNMGGTTPANDLLMTVKSIGSSGEITGVICSGQVPGFTDQYYLKVISPTEFALYEDAQMTVPVSGIGLPFNGIIQTTVTNLNSGTDVLTLQDASDFAVNDLIVFTGDMTPAVGAINAGQSYYILTKAGNDITISTEPGGTVVNIITTIASNFTVAKFGSFTLLPEPFTFTQSLVKFNNRVYVCVISNNDREFIFGKWQLLTSGDRRLNALDRVLGYYAPTENMPGVDLTQLFDGLTYPNSIYAGNKFQPSQQYAIDTVLQDKPFYPTEIDIKSILWNGTRYIAVINATSYSGLITSTTGSSWDIQKLADSNLEISSIRYINGYYFITTNSNAVPLLKSVDGITWTMSGMDISTFSNLMLNSASYYDNVWITVGNCILNSSDTYTWNKPVTFDNSLLNNMLYDVTNVALPSITGFVSVGKGQQFDYSGPVSEVVDINLVYVSSNGVSWAQITPVTKKGMYAITQGNDILVAVGENGIIYSSINGSNWYGITEVEVISPNTSTNVLNVTNTTGFLVNDAVRFTTSFNVFSSSTTYYVVAIISPTQIQLSTTLAGLPVTLTSNSPSTTTFMYQYPASSDLLDVAYAQTIFVTVGKNGTIKTSVDGVTWINRSSGTTEDLNSVYYNVTTATWVITGNNNTILSSIDNGVTWQATSVFATEPTVYDVSGADFTYGYGPEELVPGLITDQLMMTVATRPGTNWDETIYEHVGYNVVSLEIAPTSGTQTVFSFASVNLRDVQSPAQIAVYRINGTTKLCSGLYANTDYIVDWVNFTITLNSALTYLPVADIIRIDVYEVGNGNQLVKANTKTDPIRINNVTGWNEIYVNCNYTGLLYSGSGVIRPDTYSVDVISTATISNTDSIVCDSVSKFTLNGPVRFQGNVFGGVQEDVTYFVKTISYETKSITISTSVNIISGVAGPTLQLTDSVGSMTVIIRLGSGSTWTPPIIYHNGNKLVPGITNTVTRTKASTNTITTNTTVGMVVNQPIVFSNSMFGNVLVPQTTYYIKSIYDDNEFTVSTTPGGATLVLSDATGGAEFITNNYAFGIAQNGISASIIFNKGTYDSSVDYISYTLFGETFPIQYGYTIPETQIITSDGTVGPFSLNNYVGDDNTTNAVVEVNGIRYDNTSYTINSITNQITFTSIVPLNAKIAVTTFNQTQRQYLNTQFGITGKTVSKILSINNAITPYSTIVNCTNTTVTTNYITCTSTASMIPGQTVEFKGASSLGGISVDGTVYYVRAIINSTQFTIQDSSGNIITLSTAAGLIVAYVGGLPTVRVTTNVVHGFTSPVNSNVLVRIDGVLGSAQLNNNTYYVHVINSTQFDLYTQPYDPAINAVNYPVTSVSAYQSNGFAWNNNSFVLQDLTITNTTGTLTSNYLTVATNTTKLVTNTPIVFSGTVFGGISSSTVYYVKQVIDNTTFSISSTREGSAVTLTTASGTMYAKQWEQTNVDRLWVTINGYRIPSSSLRLNSFNQVSILSSITNTDKIIITSMMPSATPNEEVYLLNVNASDEPVVYRANTQTRTWLTQPLTNIDSTIYVEDVSKITDLVTQVSITPASVDNKFNIGLNVDKRIISSVTVFNNTKNMTIVSSNYQVVVDELAPILKINAGAYISVGDTLTITILLGNLIYINGEQIKFTQVDLTNNTISGLQRGANGTGEQEIIPLYTEVFGIISTNQMNTSGYNSTWNSTVYNTEGDPLQISNTSTANFLRGDIN